MTGRIERIDTHEGCKDMSEKHAIILIASPRCGGYYNSAWPEAPYTLGIMVLWYTQVMQDF